MRKSIFYLTCFLFVLVSLGTSCNGQSSNPYSANKIKAAKIEEIIQLYTDYGGFNGSALVSFEGEIIYQNGFGFANMEWDIPNTVESKFRIASITKPFTAILIMQLVANNTLELNAPISNYLPDYPKENGDKITIHHLLTHSSGISRDSGFDRPINQYPDRAQTEQLVYEFSSQPLEFNPGEKYSYSNSGYMLLAYLIETVSGKSYEAMLQEHIFDVVGMKNSGCDKHRPIIKHRTDGYFESYGNHYNANYIDMSTIIGVGNIYSTVGDLFLLDQALYTDILLPKKYRDLMFSQKIEDKEAGSFDGYGWQLDLKPIGNTSEKIATIGHSGVIDGFCAIFTRIPSSNSSIILLNNTRHAYLNAITTAVTGILNDTSYRFPLKPLAQSMNEVIEKEGIEKGILYYKTHENSDDYYISEEELIVAGYRYLHAGNAEYAAEVFKLSTEVFPKKDNPYDSYAEALMALGQYDEAIINYNKSLEINPNNDNAKKMLLELEKK